eukprot:355041-Chlamydomonas_euryale.AAC.11
MLDLHGGWKVGLAYHQSSYAWESKRQSSSAAQHANHKFMHAGRDATSVTQNFLIRSSSQKAASRRLS